MNGAAHIPGHADGDMHMLIIYERDSGGFGIVPRMVGIVLLVPCVVIHGLIRPQELIYDMFDLCVDLSDRGRRAGQHGIVVVMRNDNLAVGCIVGAVCPDDLVVGMRGYDGAGTILRGGQCNFGKVVFADPAIAHITPVSVEIKHSDHIAMGKRSHLRIFCARAAADQENCVCGDIVDSGLIGSLFNLDSLFGS